MGMPRLPIQTESLTLRAFQRGDADMLYRYFMLPDAQRYFGNPARDAGELRSILDGMLRQTRMTRPGETVTLAAVRRSDDVLTGHVSLLWTDATASQAELRFAFDPVHAGQPYAGEALAAALRLGFRDLGFHRIFARCGGRNPNSARLLRELGMRIEAHFREHALFQGEWDEELVFALLDREWQRGSKVRELTRHKVA